MGAFSIWHLLVVLVVAMLLFGAGRVSDIGKGLGEGIRNFKKGLKEEDEAPGPKRTAGVAADEDVEVEIVRVPKALPKKKKVIQIEVAEDATEEEIAAARAAAKKKALEEES